MLRVRHSPHSPAQLQTRKATHSAAGDPPGLSATWRRGRGARRAPRSRRRVIGDRFPMWRFEDAWRTDQEGKQGA